MKGEHIRRERLTAETGDLGKGQWPYRRVQFHFLSHPSASSFPAGSWRGASTVSKFSLWLNHSGLSLLHTKRNVVLDNRTDFSGSRPWRRITGGSGVRAEVQLFPTPRGRRSPPQTSSEVQVGTSAVWRFSLRSDYYSWPLLRTVSRTQSQVVGVKSYVQSFQCPPPRCHKWQRHIVAATRTTCWRLDVVPVAKQQHHSTEW